MSRDVEKADVDFAGFRAFGPRVPVTADDIARFGDLSLGIASSAALGALPITSGMDTGYPKWVATRRRLFMLDKTPAASALPAEPGNVIIGADGVSRWLAMPVPDAVWNSLTAITVNPAAGDDETTTPKTLRELNRRLFGSLYDFQSIITLANDVPLSDSTVLHNVRCVNGLGLPTMVGTKTQIGSNYTVTSFTPSDPAAVGGGTGYFVNATGIGDPGNVGKLIENLAGTKCAWIQDNPTANQVRVIVPCDVDPLAGTGVANAVSFAGETLRVYEVTQLPVYPFGPLASFSALGWLRFGFGYGAQFDAGQLASGGAFIARCKSEGAFVNGGLNGEWSGCLFTVAPRLTGGGGFVPTTLNMHEAVVHYCGVNGGATATTGLALTGGTVLQASGTDAQVDVQASSIRVASSKLDSAVCPVSAFGCSASPLFVADAGSVRVQSVYGRGNSGHALTTPRGLSHYIGSANYGTSAAHLALVASEEKDLPVSALDTGTFVAGAA